MNCPVAHLKGILEGFVFTCTSRGSDFLKVKVQVSVQELKKVDLFYSCLGNPSLFFAVTRNDAHSTLSRGAAVSLQFGLLSFNSSDDNEEDAEKKKLHNQLSGE